MTPVVECCHGTKGCAGQGEKHWCRTEQTHGYREGALTEDEAKAMLERLTKHYGDPVMPVSRYCAALNLWASALRMKADRLSLIQDPNEHVKDEAASAEKFADKVGDVFMQITKSNLLWRLIYAGESLRKEECPVHKGCWSGCAWNDDPKNNCDCQRMQRGGVGANVTGWIP